MKGFKGFEKDLTCRGFQYEEGKTFEMDKAELCKSGFHACERPLDIFGYYPPGSGSVYHAVELEDVCDVRHSDDSKVCGKKITIGAKLSIRDLVNAQIQFTKEHCKIENTDPKMATAGDSGAATAGNFGAATAGNFGAATAGDSGAATAGDYGAATAGFKGAATAGDSGAATAGNFGAATAGNFGAATAGDSGAATSRGKSAVGKNGLAVARGNNVRVKGGIGAVLVLAEEESDSSYNLVAWKVAVVDGETIKADVWYCLKNGEFVEVK